MNSNICTVSIFINSFTSYPDDRVRIQNESHVKQINTCLIKEVGCIYWYIYKLCVIISIKINSSSLQGTYLYKRGELLMDQRRSLKELNLLDKSLTVNYYHREPLISTCWMKSWLWWLRHLICLDMAYIATHFRWNVRRSRNWNWMMEQRGYF